MRETTIVVLGVEHSIQLVSEFHQPAVFRAFNDRVSPHAICIERSPEEFARSDFYEFTYEQQFLTVPYAKDRGIPVYPIDWLPKNDDQALVWGISDLESPPFLRNQGGFQGFVSFPEENRSLDFFFAEQEEHINKYRSWCSQPQPVGAQDFPRRLFLYRTFLQAMRIKAVIDTFPGKTVLVVVGAMHKSDIENILGNTPGLRILQPSYYGYPTQEELKRCSTTFDLFAIASFNLLGVQSHHVSVNWDWVTRIMADMAQHDLTSETKLLDVRYRVLRGVIKPADAVNALTELLLQTNPAERFTFTGVKDRRRVDSYFDPWGNMTVKQRIQVELAREYRKLGRDNESHEILTQLKTESDLTALQKQQIEGYWNPYVTAMD